MAEMPNVNPGDWIHFRGGLIPLKAVVCDVLSEEFREFGDIEVVYLNGPKAINTYAVWVDDHWEFAGDGVDGGYADRNQRLREYVWTLRQGR